MPHPDFSDLNYMYYFIIQDNLKPFIFVLCCSIPWFKTKQIFAHISIIQGEVVTLGDLTHYKRWTLTLSKFNPSIAFIIKAPQNIVKFNVFPIYKWEMDGAPNAFCHSTKNLLLWREIWHMYQEQVKRMPWDRTY